MTPDDPVTLTLRTQGGLLHRQLFVMLRQQIRTGRLHDGEQLPTQEELCRQFSVSRITVRRAMTDLQNEGLVRNVQGVGAFVTASPQSTSPAASLGLIGELHRTYEQTTMRLLSLARARCPARIATSLELPDNAEAVHVVRVRSRHEVPVMLLEAWIPSAFAARVTPRGLARTPLYELVSGGPEGLGKVAQVVSASLADPMAAQALNVEVNSPVLLVERLMHNREGDPIEHLAITSTPARTRMVMTLPADQINTLDSGRFIHAVPAPRKTNAQVPRRTRAS
jgi:GntR family transcriptional regulator